MAGKPGSLTARVTGVFRLIADFVVLLLIGALWVPLQMSQHRTIQEQSEAVGIEESAEKSKRDGKRNPTIR
jgi:hypothetical protein